MRTGVVGLLAILLAAGPSSAQTSYDPAPRPTRTLEGANGLAIRVLLEAASLGGGELEIAEVTFPAGTAPSRGHRHGAVEVFYILEGELDHVVNGETHRLVPGAVGVVRPGDEVIHRVASPGPVRALVIWAPGGEVDRLAPAFRVRPGGD